MSPGNLRSALNSLFQHRSRLNASTLFCKRRFRKFYFRQQSITSVFVKIHPILVSATVVFFLGVFRLSASGRNPASVDLLPAFTNESSESIFVQADAGPNGTAIVSGKFDHVGGVPRYHLAKLNSHLALDSEFEPGFVMTNLPAPRVRTTQNGGAILVDGSWQKPHSLIRLRPDGSRDFGYLTPSILMPTNLLTEPYLVVHTNDEITFLGGIETDSRFGIFRLRPDGSLDSTVPPFLTNNLVASGDLLGLASQGENLIVLGFTRTNEGGWMQKRLVLFRLHHNLTQDDSFRLTVLERYVFTPAFFVERNGKITADFDRFTSEGLFEMHWQSPFYSSYGPAISLPDGRILKSSGDIYDDNGQFLKHITLPGRVGAFLSDENTILCQGGYIRVKPSAPTTLEVLNDGSHDFKIIAHGEANQIVILESSPDLNTWTQNAVVTAFQAPTLYFTKSISSSNVYFRARIQGLIE
jgi:hypothetical protein